MVSVGEDMPNPRKTSGLRGVERTGWGGGRHPFGYRGKEEWDEEVWEDGPGRG